jgi:hypothetical protein
MEATNRTRICQHCRELYFVKEIERQYVKHPRTGERSFKTCEVLTYPYNFDLCQKCNDQARKNSGIDP